MTHDYRPDPRTGQQPGALDTHRLSGQALCLPEIRAVSEQRRKTALTTRGDVTDNHLAQRPSGPLSE